jgi:hypothetical protein
VIIHVNERKCSAVKRVSLLADGFLNALTGGNDWANFVYGFQCWGNQFGKGARIEGNELTFQDAFARHIIYPQRKVAIRSTTSRQYHTVTVTLLGSDDLNVNDVESSSVCFGGAPPKQIEVQDINGDGKPDLMLTFDQAILNLNPRTKSAFLTGWLKNSQEIVAEGTVNSVE